MMSLAGMVLRNQLFYRKKVLPAALVAGMLLFVAASSVLLVTRIEDLAERPLRSLKTELILQNDKAPRNAGDVRTKGVILPFNLAAFPAGDALTRLDAVDGIASRSTALVLWDFDLENSRTLVALRKEDPPVGLRAIESFLEPGGRFFRNDASGEVILERHFAKLFGHDVGRFFEVGGRKLRIVGIVDFKEQSNLSNASIFLPYETGLALLGTPDRVVNQVYLSLGESSGMADVTRRLEGLFPGFSLITKDSLFKNLSSINRLLYRFGDAFVATIIPLALLLVFWVLKLQGLEFREQAVILKTLGWPRSSLLAWRVWETGFVIVLSSVVAGVLTAAVQLYVLSALRLAPLLDQGFRL